MQHQPMQTGGGKRDYGPSSPGQMVLSGNSTQRWYVRTADHTGPQPFQTLHGTWATILHTPFTAAQI